MTTDLHSEASSNNRRQHSDLTAFLAALFCGRAFSPKVKVLGPATRTPGKDDWLTYYGVCLHYISSLHNQFIAALSIQGAIALGCLAALQSIRSSPHGGDNIATVLGVFGFVMEISLTWIVLKLFRQHCVTCWMLAQVEQEELGLPPWAAIKSLLGTKGNRLFTAPSIFVLTLIYGLTLGFGLLLTGFVTH